MCALSRVQYKLFCTACRINKDHTSLMTGERGSLKSFRPQYVAHSIIIIFNK